MAKKKILMVCEAFGGGVFTYVSQLCNDMVDEFDIYLAYSLRPQTPKNYKDFLDQRVHLIEMKNVGVKGLTNFKSDIAAIKELRQIEIEIQHLFALRYLPMFLQKEIQSVVQPKQFQMQPRNTRQHLITFSRHIFLQGKQFPVTAT